MLSAEPDIGCPYCNETISLVLDLSAGSQEYIEDCSVCCQPIIVRYDCDDGQLLGISVEQS